MVASMTVLDHIDNLHDRIKKLPSSEVAPFLKHEWRLSIVTDSIVVLLYRKLFINVVISVVESSV